MKKILLTGLAVALAFSCSASKYEDGMYAEMNTSKGKIVCKLYFDKTPMTVCNFAGLAEGKIRSSKPEGTPFYDGLIFHRVIPGFMIQGGCPNGTGTGNPGYKFPDEFVPGLTHDSAGVLSMANSGPNTNGCQFFITHKPTPFLNNKHTVFGKVVEGMDVVDAIANAPRGQQDRPVENVVIQNIKIIRKGAKASAFANNQEAFNGYAAAAIKKVEDAQKAEGAKQLDLIKAKWPNATKTASGLMYIVTAPGKGPKPKMGAMVKAHYTGTLLDGKKFDSSVDRGQPFEFRVGARQVIPGWDEAFLDMTKGEKRTIILPPELGYGARGAGGVIPPNAWLVFDVELIDF